MFLWSNRSCARLAPGRPKLASGPRCSSRTAGWNARPASRQFYAWGTLSAGLHDLHWDAHWAWDHVLGLKEQLPPANQNLFCQLYSALATRLQKPDVAERLLPGVTDPALRQSLAAYRQGGKAPSLVATALRNFRHPLRAER